MTSPSLISSDRPQPLSTSSPEKVEILCRVKPQIRGSAPAASLEPHKTRSPADWPMNHSVGGRPHGSPATAMIAAQITATRGDKT
ncbi:hypothetical protein AARI_02800 [Glutamicibacter arilaitensis Re117]|uniref:Uncharacterized protein n=1 Tax=Glutamicibacter arilaitensis (strain DSM 16368 / CIP 108037 / IAM 15318 / JCM 13566 / NCIMB 14258 / Re117) TaxID=861360 RepID=A0ABM9PTJ8_GLUAR|nr:hypothetical protein AARI_02800 [Glutamicibacter arilaitensis Re117]